MSLWAIAITSIFLITCSSYAAQAQSAANGASAHPAASESAAAIPTSGNVVELLATVRDKKGKIVPNLAKTDFVLTSDGSSQEITYFPKTADVPLTLGLVVDTNSNQRELLDQERNASGPFSNTRFARPPTRAL